MLMVMIMMIFFIVILSERATDDDDDCGYDDKNIKCIPVKSCIPEDLQQYVEVVRIEAVDHPAAQTHFRDCTEIIKKIK